MKKKARSYSVDFKQEAVRRMAQATTIIGLAKESGIRRKLLYQWRDQFRAGGRAGWSDAAAGRREASQRPFPRQHPVQPSCESPS
jgi:transposase-like protein